MATLVDTAFLLVLLYYAYRAGLRLLDDDRTRHQLEGWPAHDRSRDRLPNRAPDTPAETRERELSRQLISGRIGSAAYRREMGELARRDPDRSGDPR